MSLSVNSPVPDFSVDDFAQFLDQVVDSNSDVASVQSPKKRCKVEVNSNGPCEHLAGTYHDMCVTCGKTLHQFELKELRMNMVGEISQGRKRKLKTRELLLKHKKLHLVLDLDHTLLHTILVQSLGLVTKLRPFVRTFLKEAAQMFELSVYTMGDRHYAQRIVKVLDPNNVYFGDRVVSRDDSTREFQKSLDVVCAEESAVVVLDDMPGVWIKRDQANVIQMKKYLFFRNSVDDSNGFKYCMSHSELKTDDRDEHTRETYLASVLQLLKKIHGMFFDDQVAEGENLVDRDVREVLKVLGV